MIHAFPFLFYNTTRFQVKPLLLTEEDTDLLVRLMTVLDTIIT